MKTTRQPGIFLLIKVVLLFNIGTAGFLLLILLGGIVYDSVSSSFTQTEVVLDVRERSIDTTQLVVKSSGYAFRQSKTGDLQVRMAWYTPLFTPIGFLNIPGFELSVPYLIFYGTLCFLFYRIIDSTLLESPFSDRNIRRIFWIGYILIVYDAIVVIRYVLLSHRVQEITGDIFRYDGLGPLVYFKIGILVIILAMIYRRGVQIQREQELTV